MIRILLLLAASTLAYVECEEARVTVDVPSVGEITGYSNGESYQFYGIPFAKPPTGELRWKAPEKFVYPQGYTLDAETQPDGCIQKCDVGKPGLACPRSTSEDCLYLNIFTPLGKKPMSGNNYNVMVWIHGGGFVFGTSACKLYDSKYLSSNTDTIVVTINYRLGALGFLRRKKYGIMGNMGLLDQRMAMQWVKDYIGSFGGNGKITLFGHSSGAISIGAHMVSKKSKGLFDNVIIESDGWNLPFRSIVEAETLGEKFIWELCFLFPGTNCVKTKSAEKILKAQLKLFPISILHFNLLELLIPWGPIIDKNDLEDQPLASLIKMVNNGTTIPPAIIGTTTAEGALFVGETLDKLKKFHLLKRPAMYLYDLGFAAIFGFKTRSVMELYNKQFNKVNQNDEVALTKRVSRILGDYIIVCPTNKFLEEVSKNNKVWQYGWNKPMTYIKTPDYCSDVPCHGAELAYEFGTVGLWGKPFSKEDQRLSTQVQTYWGNFANSNDPNGENANDLVNWPPFKPSASYMSFDSIGSADEGFSKVICDKLNEILAERKDVQDSNDIELEKYFESDSDSELDDRRDEL